MICELHAPFGAGFCAAFNAMSARVNPLLLAGELVVEICRTNAGGRGQVVHLDSTRAAFREQALRGNRQWPLAPRLPGLSDGLIRKFQIFQAQSSASTSRRCGNRRKRPNAMPAGASEAVSIGRHYRGATGNHRFFWGWAVQQVIPQRPPNFTGLHSSVQRTSQALLLNFWGAGRG